MTDGDVPGDDDATEAPEGDRPDSDTPEDAVDEDATDDTQPDSTDGGDGDPPEDSMGDGDDGVDWEDSVASLNTRRYPEERSDGSEGDEQPDEDQGGEDVTAGNGPEGSPPEGPAGAESDEQPAENGLEANPPEDDREAGDTDDDAPDESASADPQAAEGASEDPAISERAEPTGMASGETDETDDQDSGPSTGRGIPRRQAGPNPVPDSAEKIDDASEADEQAEAEAGSAGTTATIADQEFEPDHAPDDQEMPLADHVEEMVRRLGVVLVLMAGVSAVVFPFGEQIINVIWYSFLPGTFDLCPTTSVVPREPGAVVTAAMGDVGAGPGVTMAESATITPSCPRVYHPLATIFARFKVATLAGFVIALPAVVYETYLFMRPGLFPRERRYYLAAVPTSLVLAAVGVAFAYLLVLPAIFTYFLYYSEGAAEIAFGLTETFDLMVLMLGFFAAIFQIPLFIMLAIMMGVTSRQWLADRRLLFWAAFAGIAFLFNPDPTGMAPFIVAATMIVLFEGTLLLLSWTGSGGLMPSPEAVRSRRPYAWLVAVVAGYLASDLPVPSGYYDSLPALLRVFIESNDLQGVTPIVVGGLLVAVFELLVFVLRRYLPIGVWRRRLFTGRVSLRRLRTPVWVFSLVVGYLTSPRPFLLDQLGAVSLPPIQAAGLAIGLIVAFEVLLAVWQYRRPAEDERLPLER